MPPWFEPMADFGDGDADILLIGKIDLDVVFRSRRPWAVLGECLPGAGDDPPALARKAFHGRVADAAAGAGQNDGLSGVELGLGRDLQSAM